MGARSSTFGDPITLAVGALAVHRTTRLLVEDEVTRPLRERVEEWAVGDTTTAEPEAYPNVAYLIRCPRCVSVWVALGWAGLAAAAPSVARPLGAVLAWSAVAGLLSTLE